MPHELFIKYYDEALKAKQSSINAIAISSFNFEKSEVDSRFVNLKYILKNKLREKFILVGTDGPHNNVIKSKPPICFTRENVKSICYAIKEILNN